jgi:hypothetical protein
MHSLIQTVDRDIRGAKPATKLRPGHFPAIWHQREQLKVVK